MAQIYRMVSIAAFSLAGVSLVLAVIFWVKFRIWKVISDLSGRTAKKSIEQMRAANEKSGKKSYRPTPVAAERGKLTEPIRQGKQKEEAAKEGEGTEVLQYTANGTEVLAPAGQRLEKADLMLMEDSVTAQEQESFRILQDIVLIHTNEVISCGQKNL